MLKKLSILMIAALPSIALAERDLDDLRTNNEGANEWRLAKNDNRHKIKVFVKNEDGQSIRSFRV